MSELNDPVVPERRFIILDALRGFALLGICLANYSEFSMYSFLDSSVTMAMSTAEIDRTLRYLQYIFIDGKFYTLFSILFGIGFSIILSNASQSGKSGLKIFYRRMAVLFLFGLFHLIFLWAGDILALYAFLGFFLPFFCNVSDRRLLLYACISLLLPILIDAGVEMFHWNLAAPAVKAAAYYHNQFGINSKNFPVWLAKHQSYADILKFNIAGSFIRMQEFIDGSRAFKVLGLFQLGLFIGRNKFYEDIEKFRILFKKVRMYGFIIGLPASFLYAFSAINGHFMGLTVHSALYAVSILPLSLAYSSSICLWYNRNKQHRAFSLLAASGRMALSNYIAQSIFGIIIFYGIGLGFGASVGLGCVELIAVGIVIIQMLYSHLWMHNFQFGPLEWIWRMITYKKWLRIVK